MSIDIEKLTQISKPSSEEIEKEANYILRNKKRKRYYEKEEDEFINKYWKLLSDKEIGKYLHRSYNSICRRRRVLDLHRRTPLTVLTSDVVKALKELRPLPYEAIAEITGISYATINQYVLGHFKPEDYTLPNLTESDKDYIAGIIASKSVFGNKLNHFVFRFNVGKRKKCLVDYLIKMLPDLFNVYEREQKNSFGNKKDTLTYALSIDKYIKVYRFVEALLPHIRIKRNEFQKFFINLHNHIYWFGWDAKTKTWRDEGRRNFLKRIEQKTIKEFV